MRKQTPPSRTTEDSTLRSIELALRKQEPLEPALRSVALDDAFWQRYEEFLKNNYDKKTIYDRLSYAKRYGHVLIESNAQDLLTLDLEKQKHAMKALAVLSKFLGCYDSWKSIKENYQLKWSNGDSLKYFENFFDGGKSYTVMMEWLTKTCSNLPEQYGSVLKYCTLTGLRAEEACRSISLLQTDKENYLREDELILEHYRYPAVFLRRTKKAYVSVVTDDILVMAEHCGKLSYSAMNCYLRKHGLEMNMKYCRKIFSTHLRNCGLQPEIIDLLQGRVPKTVFARHYNRPDFRPKEIRQSLDSLYGLITK